MGLKNYWNYFKELSKNVFFDEFKPIDAIVHKNEFDNLGSSGEQYTYRALWYYFQDNLFRNVYIRKEDGDLTEIDLVAVGNRGIYVFESKNWSGHIYADGDCDKWLVYCGGKKNYPLSPVKQNEGHIRALQYHLGKLVPKNRFFSVIIFSARCKLSMKNINDNVTVVKRDWRYNDAIDKALRGISANSADFLSNADIEKICRFLKKAQRPDEEIREEHLRSLEK